MSIFILFLALTGLRGTSNRNTFSLKAKRWQSKGKPACFAEIEQQLMAGEWLRMFPVLLAMAGLLGLFLFGSATAWLGMENKLVAGLIVIVALFAIIRTVSAFARA